MTIIDDARKAARPSITIVHADTEQQLRTWTEISTRTTDRPSTFEDLLRSLERRPRQLRSIAFLDGEPVATACAVPDRLKNDGAMFVSLHVMHDHRKRGIGSALHDDLVQWMREHGGRQYEVTVRDIEPEALTFWARRGCTEVERDIVVALDTRRYGGPPELAPGVTVASLAERPDLIRDIYEVGAATWRDIPVHEPCKVISFGEWREIIQNHSENRPEALFAASLHGRVVGYSHIALPSNMPAVGWHNFTGVLREYRRRGIACSLKIHAIDWAVRNGRFTLMTGNHADNAPMRHINEALGYRRLYAEVTMKGAM